jgi:hypothetical protein
VHRLGQRKDVLVLRFVSVGPEEGVPSVEEHMCRVAERKLKQEALVIGRGDFSLVQQQQGKAVSDADLAEALAAPRATHRWACWTARERGSGLGLRCVFVHCNSGDGGGGDKGIRLDLLTRDALDAVCARSDEELARLMAEDDMGWAHTCTHTRIRSN